MSNGITDDYLYDPTDDERRRAEEDDMMAYEAMCAERDARLRDGNGGVECPFCGHDLEERGGAYRCDNCEVEWECLEEVEIDRNEGNLDDYADEPSDADLFDRGMRVGTAGWAWR